LQLTWLIFSHGRLRHSGEDFNTDREESVKELQDFIPHRVGDSGRRPTSQNGIIKNLLAQASFLKNSLNKAGGHLTVNGVSYIRIPKAASTSMSKALLEKMYPTLTQKTITETQVNFITDLNLQIEVVEHPIFFTIVRNPFSRLVSVYRDLLENKDHYIYRDYLFGILPQQISFSEFIERISRIPDRLKDQHLKPQHAFLKYYEQKNLAVKVFKLEEPEPLNQFLNQYDLKMPHINKSSGPYDYRSYYNWNTFNQVREVYQADIDRFGYKKEAETLLEHLKTVQK
jgi:hypothetical protein